MLFSEVERCTEGMLDLTLSNKLKPAKPWAQNRASSSSSMPLIRGIKKNVPTSLLKNNTKICTCMDFSEEISWSCELHSIAGRCTTGKQIETSKKERWVRRGPSLWFNWNQWELCHLPLVTTESKLKHRLWFILDCCLSEFRFQISPQGSFSSNYLQFMAAIYILNIFLYQQISWACEVCGWDKPFPFYSEREVCKVWVWRQWMLHCRRMCLGTSPPKLPERKGERLEQVLLLSIS